MHAYSRFLTLAVVSGAIGGCCHCQAPPHLHPLPPEAHYIPHPRAELVAAAETFQYTGLRSGVDGNTDTIEIVLERRPRKWPATVNMELRDAPQCGTLVTPLAATTEREHEDVNTLRQQAIQAMHDYARTLWTRC